MGEIKRPVNQHKAYHAHVYFDASSFMQAKTLYLEAGNFFAVKIGRFHEKLVGPHPKWSCQMTFTTKDFDQLIPWLDAHRGGLSILVHALTGDNLKDHTEFAYWLGDPLDLNISIFK